MCCAVQHNAVLYGVMSMELKGASGKLSNVVDCYSLNFLQLTVVLLTVHTTDGAYY